MGQVTTISRRRRAASETRAGSVPTCPARGVETDRQAPGRKTSVHSPIYSPAGRGFQKRFRLPSPERMAIIITRGKEGQDDDDDEAV